MELLEEVGMNIRHYRRKRNMTIEQLAQAVCKSKSCVSKYETGRIAVDITALYDIADALGVKVSQLLYHPKPQATRETEASIPAFFAGLNTFYLYYYDGRINQIIHCVADVLDELEDGSFQTRMYMNIKDYGHYHQCENVYSGTLSHYSSMSIMLLQNESMKLEQYQLAIPSPCISAPTKWGLAFGISTRPLMPTSAKLLVSREVQKESEDFRKSLIISKEDIRLLKHYNMLTIL